jgi:predicted alpha/beta hydrolase family esterase
MPSLIVPGLDGSPAPHWQHWWLACDPSAILVHQEDWSNPVPEIWEAEIAGAILHHPGAIVVAHSLGCLVVARLLSAWPQLRVSGALLVAPCDPRRSVRLARFGGYPRHPLGVPAIVAASRTDPWMTIGEAFDLAAAWGAEFVDMGAAGHINTASGFGPWPQGLILRDRLAGRAAPAATREPRTGPLPLLRRAL